MDKWHGLFNGNHLHSYITQTCAHTYPPKCLSDWWLTLDRNFSSLKSYVRENIWWWWCAQYSTSIITCSFSHTIHESVSINRSSVIMYLVNLIYCVVTTTTPKWKKEVNKWVVFSFSSSSLSLHDVYHYYTDTEIQWKTKQDFKVKLINVCGMMRASSEQTSCKCMRTPSHTLSQPNKVMYRRSKRPCL